MKFTTYLIADISTAHITQSDAAILRDPSVPGRLAELDALHGEDGGPGMILSVGTVADHVGRVDEYRFRGLSDAFIAIMGELARREIPYVRFDRDGETVDGAQTFVW